MILKTDKNNDNEQGSGTDEVNTSTPEQNTVIADTDETETYFEEFGKRVTPFDETTEPPTEARTFFPDVKPDPKQVQKIRTKTSSLIVKYGDKGIAFLLKMIAGEGDLEDFQLDAEDRKEISEIVQQMLPTEMGQGVPPWVQLVIAIGFGYAPAVSNVIDIRKERKKLEAEREQMRLQTEQMERERNLLQAERLQTELREQIRREEAEKLTKENNEKL